MNAFEASSFFVVGYVRSQDEGKQLAAAMPDCFREKGHFTIAAIPNRKGLHAVRWSCHALDQVMPLVRLPFEVVTPDDLAD